MKFGKTLKKLSETDQQYGSMYLQYKLLRKFLNEHAHEQQTQVLFLQMLENEHARIKKIVEIKLTELQLSCESVMTNVRALAFSSKDSEEKTSILAGLTQRADDLAFRLAGLERYVYFNMEGFRKVVKKHDKLTAVSLSWIESQRLRTFFVNAQSELEQVLVQLSDLYKFIKENSPAGVDKGQHKVSEDTFERKSHKYWVAAQDLFQFKVKVIKHLPLHFFARKSTTKESKDVSDLLLQGEKAPSDEGLERHGWITSIYMDNDDMGCYKSRIDMLEGATLFRVRWYGDPKDITKTDGMVLPRAPAKGLYYERKTHHESWVNQASVKERFPIGGDQVTPFMAGDLAADQVVKEEKLLGLAEGFQTEIVKRKLHPVIRTAYKRTAFQHDDTNDVRITLDTHLTFVNEHPRFLKEGQWKRPEADIEKDGTWEIFPFAVLEVKLKAEAPDWLDGILKEDYIRQVSKFSKFQQACSTFYPYKVNKFPFWFDQEDITRVKSRHDDQLARERGEPTRKQEEKAAKVKAGAASADHVTVEIDSEAQAVAFTNKAFVPDAQDEKKVFRDPTYSVHIEDDSKGKNGKVANGKGNGKNGGGKKDEEYGGISGKARGKKGKVATARVRVEPKTHFANERTMLQWLRIGLTLFSFGGVIFNLSTDQAAIISGMVFMVISAFVVLYGMTMYYWRMDKIIKRANVRFHDKYGPGVLVVIFVIALVVNVILTFQYKE